MAEIDDIQADLEYVTTGLSMVADLSDLLTDVRVGGQQHLGGLFVFRFIADVLRERVERIDRVVDAELLPLYRGKAEPADVTELPSTAASGSRLAAVDGGAAAVAA